MEFRKSLDTIESMLITHEWNRHRKFLGLLEPQLADAVRDWEDLLNQQAQQIEDDDQRDDFYHFYLDDYHDMEHHKVILMNSFFAASFALFEYHLTWLCDDVQQRRGNPFSVRDLKHSLTDRAKFYLKKLDVPFPSDAPEWEEIIKYQEIRNKIMHEGGYISCEWSNFTYAQDNGIVGGDKYTQRLELTRAFCEGALADFQQFLLRVSRRVSRATRQTADGQSDS